jgi:hypothetical protein
MPLDTTLRSLRVRIGNERRQKIQYLLNTRFRGVQHVTFRALFGSNLDMLALLNVTDKNTVHRYTQHYARHLAPYRRKRVKLLEIGIGGYNADPKLGGGSLRMWRTYFPKGRIYGLDIEDKSPHEERRIKIFRGSQADTDFLGEMVEKTGPLDIIIDDGSHRCDHVITSFEFLFPRMAERGVYVIEDVQTSYWKALGGSDDDPDRPDTTMGYFKRFIHGVNYEERPSWAAEPSFYDKNILGISFYHNLIIIEKGPNTEGGASYLHRGTAYDSAASGP